MDKIELVVTIQRSATMLFDDGDSRSGDEYRKPAIRVYGVSYSDDLCFISSYKEYLKLINDSKPNWTLEQHRLIYEWMRKVGWLHEH